MPGSALLILSAVLHASWNALVRRAHDKESAPLAMVIVCMLASCAWALVVDRGITPPRGALVWTVVAGLAEGGYVVSLGRALRDAPLGLAYAVSRGGAMVVVWPLSIALLGEHATARALVGAVGLGVGLVMASVSNGVARSRARLAWSWTTAAFIAGYHLAYGRALASGIRAPTAIGGVLSAASFLIFLEGLRRTGAGGALAAQYIDCVHDRFIRADG